MPAEASATSRLLAALSARSTLLVLDNCEHLVDGWPELAERVLTYCPGVRVGGHSREPLRAAGEHMWPVSVLDETAATRLFTDRATAVRPGFARDSGRSRGRRRDLPAPRRPSPGHRTAAARMRTMMWRRSGRRWPTGSPRCPAATAPRTAASDVAGAVAWSWDLLSEVEQAFCDGCQYSRRSRPRGRHHMCSVAASRRARLPCGQVAALGDRRALPDAGDGRRLRGRASGRGRRVGGYAPRPRAYLLSLMQSPDPHLRRRELTWLRLLADEHENLLAATAVGGRR